VLTEKHFFRLLVLVALTDWLISRGLARVAIFIPKSPVLINGYQGLTFIGQYASVLSALLSLLGIGLIAWQLRRRQGGIPSAALACLGLLSLVFLLSAPSGWLQLLSVILVLGISLIGGLIIGLPFILIAAPALLALLSEGEGVMQAGLLVSGLCLVAYLPVMILLSGILRSFIGSAWTLTFLRLTTPAQSQVEVLAEPLA
jgi:hypothetical protein